jgi:hypothetical protein
MRRNIRISWIDSLNKRTFAGGNGQNLTKEMTMDTIKVLYIAAECKPFSKVGGVADVAGELPLALLKEGIDIEIVVPFFEGEQKYISFEKLSAFRKHEYNVRIHL